jgi:hypothetical protein
VAVCVGLVVFFVFSALGLGGRAARRAAPTPAPFAAFSLRAPHVLSKYTLYSVSPPPSTPSFAPMSAFYLERPIALYRACAIAQLSSMESQITRLQHALTTNDRLAAQDAWRAAY